MLLFISVLPVFLICLIIYMNDKEKEPIGLLSKLFIFGILSCIPSFLVEIFLVDIFNINEETNTFEVFIPSFLVVALVEEFFKFLIIKRVTYNNSEFDELYDMIVYAVFVSLGFAFLENFCYVQLYGFYTGIFRAVLSVPSHACNGVLMGYYLGMAKIKKLSGDVESEKKYIIYSLLIAVITHGIYDFFIFSNNLLLFILLIVYVIILYVFCIKKVYSVSKNKLKL